MQGIHWLIPSTQSLLTDGISDRVPPSSARVLANLSTWEIATLRNGSLQSVRIHQSDTCDESRMGFAAFMSMFSDRSRHLNTHDGCMLIQVTVSDLSTPITFHLRSKRVSQRWNTSPFQQGCTSCPEAYDAVCYYPGHAVRLDLDGGTEWTFKAKRDGCSGVTERSASDLGSEYAVPFTRARCRMQAIQSSA